MHTLSDPLNVTTLACSRLPRSCLLILVVLCCGFSPLALALDPPPDGGYLNLNTAEGDGALFNLTDGTGNTAMGFEALTNNKSGNYNTAIGEQALWKNTGDANTAVGENAMAGHTSGDANTAVGNSASLPTPALAAPAATTRLSVKPPWRALPLAMVTPPMAVMRSFITAATTTPVWGSARSRTITATTTRPPDSRRFFLITPSLEILATTTRRQALLRSKATNRQLQHGRRCASAF